MQSIFCQIFYWIIGTYKLNLIHVLTLYKSIKNYNFNNKQVHMYGIHKKHKCFLNLQYFK